MRIRTWLSAAMVCMGVAAAPTMAAFTVTFQQTGGNVVATGSGTINTAALTVTNNAVSDSAEICATFFPNSLLVLGPVADTEAATASPISGPTSFGSGSSFDTLIGSGDEVGFVADDLLYIPNNYVSGTALSDTDTWSSATFASLGITPGTYTWTWGSGPTADSFTMIANLPEPASLGVLGFAGLALLRRRRGASGRVAGL